MKTNDIYIRLSSSGILGVVAFLKVLDGRVATNFKLLCKVTLGIGIKQSDLDSVSTAGKSLYYKCSE